MKPCCSVAPLVLALLVVAHGWMPPTRNRRSTTLASTAMWPPLPPGTPVTPLPKDLKREEERQRELAEDNGLGPPPPGIEVKSLKQKVLNELPLEHFAQVNLDFPGLRLVHMDPMIFVVPDFLSSETCDRYVALADQEDLALEVGSPTFSGGVAAETRTSTSWFMQYKAVPELLDRTKQLLSQVSVRQFEEPQLVRYLPGQQFRWHLDQVPPTMLENGGQRIATLLVYLNDVQGEGATTFRDLGLSVYPKKGMALLFFPAFAGAGTIGGEDDGADKISKKKKKKKMNKQSKVPTVPLSFEAGDGDERTLHAGATPFVATKWIAQMWTHERAYEPQVPPGNQHPPGLVESEQADSAGTAAV